MGHGDASRRQNVGSGSQKTRTPATRPRPTASSNASTARSSTSTCTSVRWSRRRPRPRRSRPSSRRSTRSGRMSRGGRSDRSSCTAQIHTHFAAECPRRLTPYTGAALSRGALPLGRGRSVAPAPRRDAEAGSPTPRATGRGDVQTTRTGETSPATRVLSYRRALSRVGRRPIRTGGGPRCGTTAKPPGRGARQATGDPAASVSVATRTDDPKGATWNDGHPGPDAWRSG